MARSHQSIQLASVSALTGLQFNPLHAFQFYNWNFLNHGTRYVFEYTLALNEVPFFGIRS